MADNDYDSSDQGQGDDPAVPVLLFKRLEADVNIIANGHMDDVGGSVQMEEDEVAQPYISITEQPQARGFRFRYECEGPSHGGLQGEKSEKYKKTFPAIKIRNYVGPARVVVSLVTDEVIPRPHAHKLVGKNCTDGSCIVELKTGQNTVTFPNLCIQHVTRKKASEVIQQRIIESMKLDKLVKIGDLNAEAELSDGEKKQAKEQAEKLAKDMQLNVVKLCFQAYLRDENGQFSRLLQSVLSNPIYDSKSPGANALKICRMDKYGGCCTGNEEVFLLCEKVQKDDISVRFVEQDDDGNTVWEAYGNFGPFDVHRQYAIVFKTPPYRDQTIDRAVNVLIMLQRKSDGESSDPKSFTYYPQNFDKEEIAKKRKKTIPNYPGSGYGGSGRQMATGASNGLFDRLPTFNIPAGNLPVTVNQDSDSARTHNGGGRGRGRGRGRQNRSSPTENNDLETDAPPLPVHHPQIIQQVQQLNQPINLPTILMDTQVPSADASNSPVRPVGPPEFNPQQYIPNLNFSTFPQQSYIQQSFTQLQNVPVFGRYTARGQTSPVCVSSKVNEHSDSADSGAGDDEIDCAPPFLNMPQQISQFQEPVLLKRGDGGGGVSPQIMSQRNVMAPPSFTKQKMEINSNFMDRNIDLENIVSKKVQGEKSVTEENMTGDSKMTESNQNTDQEQLVHKEKTPIGRCDVSVQTIKDGAYKVAERTANALQSYAATGDIRFILMAQRYLLPVRDENGDTPLHTAIINNQLEVVHNVLDTMDTLPNAIRHINTYNYLLQTPLHLAVITNQPGVVDRLLCAGANPALPDRCGNTPAHLAVLTGTSNCLKALLKYLRPGVSQDEPFPEVNMLNFDGYSPAHLAAQTENLEAMKLLVHGKADINLADGKSGRCPLHYSVEADDLSVSGYLLLEAGAKIHTSCFDGNTALHIACGRQNVGMVALLMAAGADPSMENFDIQEEDESPDDDKSDTRDTTDKSGHVPEDFACENEKILKVLHGEPYTSISGLEKEVENGESEQVTSMMTKLSITAGQGTISGLSGIGIFREGSDLEKLKYPIRVQLSKLLDPKLDGSDWLALSEKLGLKKLVEGIESGHSQTRALLNYYEECGGTIERLVEALKSINRDDAVQLLQGLIVLDLKYQRSSLQDCSQMDSGVDTRSIASSHRQIHVEAT